MKRFQIFVLSIAVLVGLSGSAQDTFSIVAADSATRQVGGAGASCVDLFSAGISNVSFLSELFPGKGAINTQASYLAGNQANARSRMNEGMTPQQIVDWLQLNDVQSDPTIRQYGIVGFVGDTPVVAAYTGSNCMDVKYHRTGTVNGISYSIQGNILIAESVIDSMEARFIREDGDLRCKLMAALQGANIPGADSRCAPKGTSALFAFLHVAQPTDAFGSPSYKIGVRGRNSAPFEPIDSLQKIFNKNVSCGSSGISETVIVSRVYSVVPNPVWNEFSINLIHGTVSPGLGTVALYSLQGQKIWELPFAVGKPYTTANLPGGTYRLEWVVDGEWHYQSIIKQ